MAKQVATARHAPAAGKGVSGERTTLSQETVRPEPVEACPERRPLAGRRRAPFSSDQAEEGQGFDKLGTNGKAKAAPKRDARGRFLPRSGAAPHAAKTRARRRAAAPKRWSAAAGTVFLETLSQTGNVAASARAAGLSDTTIYRRRRTSEAFRAQWAEALREGFAKLEAEVLDRAMNGTDKPIFHAGKHVATVRQFNDNLAMQLLRQHRDAVHGPTPVSVANLSDGQIRAIVAERLSETNRRMGGKG